MADEFIQFKRKAIRLAVGISSQVGCKPSVIGWGLLMLWDHCYENRKDVDTMALVNAGVLSMYFEGLPVIQPLIDAGFIERSGDGFRVKGTDCYTFKIQNGRKGGEVTAAKNKENQPPSKVLQAEPKQRGSKGVAEPKQDPSREVAKEQKPPPATPALDQEPKQNAAEYRVDILSPTERENITTHESPVGGPPQHAPGRGRAVAPPRPEPEPEPEWKPPPLCPSGHILGPHEVRSGKCSCCARVERERVAAIKAAEEQARRERTAAIPQPPKDWTDEGIDEDEQAQRMLVYTRRVKMRQDGQDWREAMQ